MGKYCHICGRVRPNEKFSGKGHRRGICKQCQKRPKAEIKAIKDNDFLYCLLEQKHISEKNVVFLKELIAGENKDLAETAALLPEVARLKPYKKRRAAFIAKNHPALFEAIMDRGLAPDYWSDAYDVLIDVEDPDEEEAYQAQTDWLPCFDERSEEDIPF